MERSNYCCDPFDSHTKAISQQLRKVTEGMVHQYSFVALTVGEKICGNCIKKLNKSVAAIITESCGDGERGASSTATDVDSSDPDEPGPSRFTPSPRKRRAVSQRSEHYEKAADKERKETARGSETPEQTEQRLQQDRERQATVRSSETAEQTEQRLWQDRERQAAVRSSETAEQSEQRLRQDRERQAAVRSSETAEQTEQRLRQDRDRHAVNRNRRPDVLKGRRTDDIFAGIQIVKRNDVGALYEPDIFAGIQIVKRNDVGALYEPDGTPVSKCPDCHTVKWKNETKGMCCCTGKVKLEPFKEHPEVIKSLWEDQNEEAKLFRRHVRQLNNALSLACLQVTQVQAPGGHWQPSVRIQGKVFVGMGPLLPQHQDAVLPPIFAQLYVVDPEYYGQREEQLRLGTMQLPQSIPADHRGHLAELLTNLQDELRQCNPYVQDFKHACEISNAEQPSTFKLVIDAKKRPTGEHQRCFNAGFKEISVLMDDENPGERAFIVAVRGPARQVRKIEDTHRAVDPLHFVLLFPNGEDGWNLDIPRQPGDERNVTPLQFYAFHLQLRYEDGEHKNIMLFRGGKLFQEYCCVSFAKVENQRLKFIRFNQKNLRAEKYGRLCEDVHNHANNNNGQQLRTGQQVILPPSFTGSPRYMHEHFQDAVAIVREFHKPDLFITFTCNPKWPEILNSLLPGQQPEDRPDIVARVFKQKLRAFMDELINKCVFGKTVGRLYVVKFQKRGLPHAHILIILQQEDRLHTSADVDTIIIAELPEDPNNFEDGSEAKNQATKLQELVLKNMIHSCSPGCMKDGRCEKRFPKSFSDVTEWDESAFYPSYRRRSPENGGRVIEYNGRSIDNRWVVPYSPYLLLRFEAHINIEACVSPTAAKYLFKYVTKGSDRAMAGLKEIGRDEVEVYQNMRSIGSSEACWRLFQFDITERYPAVMQLRVHLPEQQYIVFNEGQEENVVAQGAPRTELDGFFEYNKQRNKDRNPVDTKYLDFPKRFTWNQSTKKWKPRACANLRTIGRFHTIHPLSGDTFYLRILLGNDHCCNKENYEQLRTVHGNICPTFKDACKMLGLLRDDYEWDQLLTEAETTQFCCQIRDLFVTILLFCEPSNPLRLFEDHFEAWFDDFRRQYPEANDDSLKWMVLEYLEERLQEREKNLKDVNLCELTDYQRNEINRIRNTQRQNTLPVLIEDEMKFDIEETKRSKEICEGMLTAAQRHIYDAVLRAVSTNQELQIFVDARGGSGKTFTLNTLLAAVRTMNNQKNIALAVASSGIAATLLSQGRTFHSRFKAPLDVFENSTLAIRPTDVLAKMILQTKLIVWDEAPMSNRYHLEALDRALRDITKVDRPFGGKVLVLAGDFRQVLPIIKYASRAQIVSASLKKSYLWNYFTIYQLQQNMRVGTNPALQYYDHWLLSIGNGQLPIKENPDKVKINEDFVFELNDETKLDLENSREAFISLIFPHLDQRFRQGGNDWIAWIAQRAILAPKNSAADNFNNLISKRFPGQPIVLTSADATVDPDDATRFPVEYLNSLTPAGFPPHILCLKEMMILMLLRNISPRQGLCNGTRLILEGATQFLLTCRIASGDQAGQLVFIPRIELKTKDKEFPFEWRRRQFPVRPAFAMTINKSQGQTLNEAGIYLEEPVFQHGQLYVAASRVGNPDKLHIAIKRSDNRLTRNVVYKEIIS